MIGQPPRIVLIDDKIHHLHGLAKALAKLDSACLPFHFEDQGPTQRQLRNVRVIFCDLHLLSDALTADTKQQLSVIAGMLAEGLLESHGPYILVIWTEFPEKTDGIQEYLDELPIGQRPIEYLCLDKKKFIDTRDGNLIAENDLIVSIQEALGKWSGVTALLWWETAVADAAADLAGALWAPGGGADLDRSEGLRQTFGKLAIGAAGEHHAPSQPGLSVNEALVPMLADRIERTKFPSEIWKGAVEFGNSDKAVPTPKLNSLVHLDFVHGLLPAQRGSVSPLLKSWDTDRWFEDKFGFPREIILKAFGFKDAQMDATKQSSSWFLIQIRAACDEAQLKPGLLPFLLMASCAEQPKGSPSGGVWKSELFKMKEQDVRFFAHANFSLGMNISETSGLKPQFRVRTSLLESIIFSVRTHAARPGTIDIR